MIMIMHPHDEKQFLARLFEDPRDARERRRIARYNALQAKEKQAEAEAENAVFYDVNKIRLVLNKPRHWMAAEIGCSARTLRSWEHKRTIPSSKYYGKLQVLLEQANEQSEPSRG